MEDDEGKPPKRDPDERVSIPAPFEEALKAMLAVDPTTVPGEPNDKPARRPAKPRKK